MELVPLMRTRLLDQPCERPLLLVPPRAKRRRPNVGFETENLLHLDDKAVIPVLLYLFRRIEHRLDGWPDPGPAGRGLVIPSARTLLMTVVLRTSLQARLGARRSGGFRGGDRDPSARRRAACGFSLPRATWEDQRKAPDTFPSFADALSRQSRRRDAIASAARFPMRMQSGMPMPS